MCCQTEKRFFHFRIGSHHPNPDCSEYTPDAKWQGIAAESGLEANGLRRSEVFLYIHE
jgi:hypothetical protein